MPLLRPRRLAAGQTIGLVAPSSAPNEPERIRFATETIESLGFRVKPGAHVSDRDGYLAGTDAGRAADLNAMFADESVDAIWCVRGSYGASRLLPALDFTLMQRAPKALIGYSDITALHMALQRHAGLVPFHGPVAFRSFTSYTVDALRSALWVPEAPIRLAAPPPFEKRGGQGDWDNPVTTPLPGRGRGRVRRRHPVPVVAPGRHALSARPAGRHPIPGGRRGGVLPHRPDAHPALAVRCARRCRGRRLR